MIKFILSNFLFVWDFYNETLRSIYSNIFSHRKIRLCDKNKGSV